MINELSRYMQKEIFSFLSDSKAIEITKNSKCFLNILENINKESINMFNFCNIYYKKCNLLPSIYILLRNFKSKVEKNDFINIYAHFVNDFITRNPNKLVNLEIILDENIIAHIINNNILNTNKISLRISSLNVLFNQNLNFKNNKNIEQIYLDIINNNYYTELNYEEEDKFNNFECNLNNLFFLKYFSRLIPTSVSKIGFEFNSLCDNFCSKNWELLLGNLNIKIDISKKDEIEKLFYEELSQYKNIKMFKLGSCNEETLKIIENNKAFFQNLNKIKFEPNFYSCEEIKYFEKLNELEYIKDNLDFKVDARIEDLKEIKNLDNYKTISYLNINWAWEYKLGEIKVNFPKNLKILEIEGYINKEMKYKTFHDFEIFKQLQNLEELKMQYLSSETDYDFLKHLKNLKILDICNFKVQNDKQLNNFFRILNQFNQNLRKLNLNEFEMNDTFYKNKIELYVDIELKNLERLFFCYHHACCVNLNYYKINRINIDKCEKLKEIYVPYFECKNQKVLNNLEKIGLYYVKKSNIEFLRTILSCKKLISLEIKIIFPPNKEFLKILLGNTGNLREINFWLSFNLFRKVKDEKLRDIICDNYENISDVFGEEFFKEIRKNIELSDFKKNHIENFNFYPPYKDTNYNSLNYENKIEYLNNFPLIEKYKQQSLKEEYIMNKIDFKQEKEIFLKYLDIYKEYKEKSFKKKYHAYNRKDYI